MSFLHDIFFGYTRFDVSEESLAELSRFSKFSVERSDDGTDVSLGASPKDDRPSPKDDRSSPKDDFPTSLLSLRSPENFVRSSPSENIPLVVPIRPTNFDKGARENQQLQSIPRTESIGRSKIEIRHPTLFWCVFVAHYGYSEYLRIGNRLQNRELEEKQKIIDTLSKNPKQLKEGNVKLTNDAVQEILSGLMVSAHDSFSALVAYAKYYHKTIYVVFECSYLVFSHTKDTPDVNVADTSKFSGETTDGRLVGKCILYQTRKHPKFGGSYRLDPEPTLETLQQIRLSKIEMEHYAKPFRGISAYKLQELNAMATKIGILDTKSETTGKTKSKTELYTQIVEKCCVGIQTL